MRSTFSTLARSRRFRGLAACLVLFSVALFSLVLSPPPSPPSTPPPLPPTPQVAVVQAPADLAAAPRRGLRLGLLLTLAGAAAAISVMANASTLAGSGDGVWDAAGNWSNGVPSSTLSAILSSTSGVMVLPERTSATTKNLSGTGKIGVCGGGVNILNIVAPSANTAIHFVAVDHLEAKNATTTTPRGHD